MKFPVRARASLLVRILAILSLSVLVLSCSTPRGSGTAGVALLVSNDGTLDSKVVGGINQFRLSKDKEPLRRHPGLDRLALEHARIMLREGEMSHDGFSSRSYQALAMHKVENLTENVVWGKGISRAAVADRIVKSWVESGGHRRNLLAPNQYIGIGVVVGVDGSFYSCQLSGRDAWQYKMMPGVPRTW